MTENPDKGAILADELVAWFLRELPYWEWLKDEYVKWHDDGITAELNVDFDRFYREHFNMPYDHVLEKQPESFAEVGLLVLLAWRELIKTNKRDQFVDEINHRLKAFEAPVRFTHKGLFHAIDPETVEYEDAREYQPSPRRTLNAAIFVIMALIIMIMLLSMALKISQSFIPPSLL